MIDHISQMIDNPDILGIIGLPKIRNDWIRINESSRKYPKFESHQIDWDESLGISIILLLDHLWMDCFEGYTG